MKYIAVAFFILLINVTEAFAAVENTDVKNAEIKSTEIKSAEASNAEVKSPQENDVKEKPDAIEKQPHFNLKNTLKNALPSLDKLYVGGAIGQSFLDGNFSNIYSVKDDTDFAFKLWMDYHFKERLYFEFELADLGSSTIQASEAALATNVFPAQFSESIAYKQVNTSVLYLYPLPYEPFSVFAKGGVSYIDINSPLDVEVKDRFSPSFGLGLQYPFKHYYSARIEYQTYNKDTSLISLGLSRRLGDPEPEHKVIEQAKPAPASPVEPEEKQEPEATPEPAVATPPVEETKALPEEPAVDMEKLFADLKNEIEPSSIFEKDSAVLSNRVMGNLDLVVYFLQQYPDVHVVITGYASDEGHIYHNENLSWLRAHGAKSYLQASGIDESRIKEKGEGEKFPRYSPQDEDYRIRNRRIEFDFYIPKKQ